MTFGDDKFEKMTYTKIFLGEFGSAAACSQTTFWPSTIFCWQHIFPIFFDVFFFSKLSGLLILIGQSVCASQNWFARLSNIYMMWAEIGVEKLIWTYRTDKRSTFRDEFDWGDM